MPVSASPPSNHDSHDSPRIALLPGDGIGPEIADACGPVLATAFPDWRVSTHGIGWSHWCGDGDPVPEETWAAVDAADATLMVAVTSKPAQTAETELAPHLRGTGLRYRSPILQLRQRLALYANIRPVTLSDGSRLTIVRENTEGLYAHDLRGTDLDGVLPHIADDPTVTETLKAGTLDDVAVSLRVTTLFGWRRLLRTAAEIALVGGGTGGDNRPTVTVADKPNVLQASGNIVLRAIDEVAEEFPGVTFTMENVDVVAMNLVTDPSRYRVIAAENVFGDILSDITAGLGGGLGVAAAANLGERSGEHRPALFEPVHGSAPDIAGSDTANPTAFLGAAAMCGDHLGYFREANVLRKALQDNEFNGSTTAYAERIREYLQQMM